MDLDKVIRETLKHIGYNKEDSPLVNDENVKIETIFTKQSLDIALGVDRGDSAGDIGIMFGGAVNEAPDLTCHSHYLARKLSHKLYTAPLVWSRPDQKTQVTIGYEERGSINVPVAIDSVVICISHIEDMLTEDIHSDVLKIVHPFLEEYGIQHKLHTDNIKYFINPTGAFSTWFTSSDSGAVGRKIVCDQYGGFFPVGGGNLNGKDATKVDRSAVYMARYVAKQVVSKGMAHKCQVQVSYAIGMPDPVSVEVDCFNTNIDLMENIRDFVDTFNFRPRAIIQLFNLRDTPRSGLSIPRYVWPHR